jgi:hypothetical protein
MTAVFAKHLGAADSTAEAGVAGDSTAEGSALAWLRAQSSVLSLAEATMAAAMAPAITTIRMSIWATARLSSMMVVVPSGSSRTIPVWNLSRVFEASLTT